MPISLLLLISFLRSGPEFQGQQKQPNRLFFHSRCWSSMRWKKQVEAGLVAVPILSTKELSNTWCLLLVDVWILSFLLSERGALSRLKRGARKELIAASGSIHRLVGSSDCNFEIREGYLFFFIAVMECYLEVVCCSGSDRSLDISISFIHKIPFFVE